MNKWTVVLARLDPVVGAEQGKTRPVVVVSENATNRRLNVVTVLPLTTRRPGRTLYSNEALLPAGTAGLPNESVALGYQIRTLDKSRLAKVFGAMRMRKCR